MLFESVFVDFLKLLPSRQLLREKNMVRELLAQKRRILTKDVIQQESALVIAQVEQLSAFRAAKTVLLYYPMHNEVDLLPLIKRYKKEKTFLFPVVHRRSMTVAPYEGNAKMHRGKYRIPEPTTPTYRGPIDLILMPAVGFDKHCNRLGRGGGYYDRFLARVKKSTVLVGVGYDFQLIDEVPVGRHDKRMDYVITPNHNIIKTKKD